MSQEQTAKPSTHMNIRIPLQLKNRVEQIALTRKHQSGERVTVTDTVIEALEKLVEEYDNSEAPND